MSASRTLSVRVRRPLRDFELSVEFEVDRWPVVLMGRSGAGKTQLLRCLAGLEPGASGRIVMDGVVWLGNGIDLPPHRRSIGLSVQEGELFPHLSVLENVAYPLRFRRRTNGAERHRAARACLARFGVEHLAPVPATHVSGGERGRIALARALVAAPHLLLADEPFAALDPDQRRSLGEEMNRAILPVAPILWVTHDRHEADLLSRTGGVRLVLERGRIVERVEA